ncbi:MAG TPA: hypothetical protein VJW23_10185 [Propionibacteriaceae bacterium]|nr:hypothetical protein [Propionibacteriaceae bacterium]
MTEHSAEKDAPAIALGVSNFFGGDVFEHYQGDGYFIVATTDESALELEPGDFVVKRKWSTSVVPYVHRVIPSVRGDG